MHQSVVSKPVMNHGPDPVGALKTHYVLLRNANIESEGTLKLDEGTLFVWGLQLNLQTSLIDFVTFRQRAHQLGRETVDLCPYQTSAACP